MNDVIFLVGPTGSGKTNLAIEIAKKINAEIISADSMTVYKNMDIGTAKPSLYQREQITHYLIDIVFPKDNFSAADFSRQAEDIIKDIILRNKVTLLVGGSGLYIKALIDGLFPDTKADWNIRHRLEEEAKEYGTVYLHNRLKEVDCKSAEKIHPNDLRRIIRALEIYEKTGVGISTRKKETQGIKDKYNIKLIGIIKPRKQLYEDIDERVNQMFSAGLVEEVKAVVKDGIGETAKEALGYKEIIAYLSGECTLEEAKELVKKNTRKYAKRQLTWFRADKRIKWVEVIDSDNIDKTTNKIMEIISA